MANFGGKVRIVICELSRGNAAATKYLGQRGNVLKAFHLCFHLIPLIRQRSDLEGDQPGSRKLAELVICYPCEIFLYGLTCPRQLTID